MSLYVLHALNWLYTPQIFETDNRRVVLLSSRWKDILLSSTGGEISFSPFGGGKLISIRPHKPAWAFTAVSEILTQLGVDPRVPTRCRFTGVPSSGSFVDFKPYSLFGMRYHAGFSTVVIQDNATGGVVGFVFHDSVNKQTIVYLEQDRLGHNPDTLSIFRPFGQKGDYHKDLHRSLAYRRDNLNRDKADILRRLEAVDAKLNSLPTEIQPLLPNPKILGASQNREWIYIWLSDLYCSADEKLFFLGGTILAIYKTDWTVVTSFATAPRAIAHPHETGDGLCLGRQFKQVATELQDRGLFGMYVNLLIEHLENGIDPQDSAGVRVLSLPEAKGHSEPISPQAELPLNVEAPSPATPNWATVMPGEIPGTQYVLRGNVWEMGTIRE